MLSVISTCLRSKCKQAKTYTITNAKHSTPSIPPPRFSIFLCTYYCNIVKSLPFGQRNQNGSQGGLRYLFGLVTVQSQSFVFHYAPIALKAKGLCHPDMIGRTVDCKTRSCTRRWPVQDALAMQLENNGYIKPALCGPNATDVACPFGSQQPRP